MGISFSRGGSRGGIAYLVADRVVVLRWNFLKAARVAINFFFSSLPFPSLTEETLRALFILL